MRSELKLTLLKETKGTFVFGSTDQDAPIPSVYIKKSAFPGKAPETLKVTLESDDA